MKQSGYNKLFYETFKNKNSDKANKFIISKQYNNISRDFEKIHWLNHGNYTSIYDPQYQINQLRSRFHVTIETKNSFELRSKSPYIQALIGSYDH